MNESCSGFFLADLPRKSYTVRWLIPSDRANCAVLFPFQCRPMYAMAYSRGNRVGSIRFAPRNFFQIPTATGSEYSRAISRRSSFGRSSSRSSSHALGRLMGPKYKAESAFPSFARFRHAANQTVPRSSNTPQILAERHPVKPQPIVPWIGGKRRLAKHIIPTFPEHTCYVEPFAGAAAIFFLKEPSKAEVLNDFNGEVTNLYRVVQHHLEEFVRQFKWALVSRQIFKWEKMKRPETLTDIQRAARFFYLQKLCFGGKVQSQTFGTTTSSAPRMNILRLEEELSTAHIRLANAQIEHLDWAECVRRYDRPHTLFYCDPPYWETEGYGIDFPLDQYALMADLARTIQGRMIISVGDHPEMHKAFAGLRMERQELRYTVGGGAKATEKRGELIFRNW